MDNISELERERERPEFTEAQELSGFRERLDEAIAWCSSREPSSDALRVFRSPELAPDPFAVNGWGAVWSVAEKRRAKLPKGKRRPIGGLSGGRLVACMPEVNLCDGAAEYSSEGYFDVDNIPPWDTWVWYASGK